MDMIENESEEMSQSGEETEEREFSLGEDSCSCSSCATSDANIAEFDGVLLPPCQNDGEMLQSEGIPKLTDMVWHTTNMALRPFTVVCRIYPQLGDSEEISLPLIRPDVRSNVRLPWANFY